MVTLKIIFDTRRQKSDSTYPIVFRITEGKKVANLYSDISIATEFWDIENKSISKLHPNAQALNLKLSKRFYELQKAILNLESDHDFNFDNLKETLNSKDKPNLQSKSFYEFSLEIIDQMIQEGRIGNAIVYRTAVNRLISFFGNRNLKLKKQKARNANHRFKMLCTEFILLSFKRDYN